MIPPRPGTEKPSPLLSIKPLRTGLTTISIVRASRWRTEATVPMRSPTDLGVSIEAQRPRFPSIYREVYPRLKVLSVAGVKPRVTVPKEARQ